MFPNFGDFQCQDNLDYVIVIQKRILSFCEAFNGFSFYFLASLIKNLLVKTVFVGHYLKLSLPIVFKFFLVLPSFNRMLLLELP